MHMCPPREFAPLLSHCKTALMHFVPPAYRDLHTHTTMHATKGRFDHCRGARRDGTFWACPAVRLGINDHESQKSGRGDASPFHNGADRNATDEDCPWQPRALHQIRETFTALASSCHVRTDDITRRQRRETPPCCANLAGTLAGRLSHLTTALHVRHVRSCFVVRHPSPVGLTLLTCSLSSRPGLCPSRFMLCHNTEILHTHHGNWRTRASTYTQDTRHR